MKQTNLECNKKQTESIDSYVLYDVPQALNSIMDLLLANSLTTTDHIITSEATSSFLTTHYHKGSHFMQW